MIAEATCSWCHTLLTTKPAFDCLNPLHPVHPLAAEQQASEHIRDATAEAALATARREADELRDRLTAVEALADEWERIGGDNPGAIGLVSQVRAALATTQTGPRPSVVCDHDPVCPRRSDGWPKCAAPLRAALANPSAAQGEAAR